MKKRNGFVSNSSSSSFVIICPADELQELWEKFAEAYPHRAEHEEAVMREWAPRNVFGQEAAVFGGWYTHGIDHMEWYTPKEVAASIELFGDFVSGHSKTAFTWEEEW
jgi:hypothetical protein